MEQPLTAPKNKAHSSAEDEGLTRCKVGTQGMDRDKGPKTWHGEKHRERGGGKPEPAPPCMARTQTITSPTS